MYKKILVLVVLSVFLAGCVSNAEQQKPLKITLDMTRSYFADSYDSGRGYDYDADVGKEFYVLYFTAENISYNQEFKFRRYNMEISCCNVVYTPTIYYGPDGIEDVTILKGGKIEGFILYEVTKNDCDIYWRYNSSLPIETVTIRK